MADKVFVITVHEYECGPSGTDDAFVLGVYASRERAIEVAVGEAASKFNHIYCEECDIGSEEYCWGEWEELPDTEDKRTEDDDYSKEGIFNAIRAAGGSFSVRDGNGESYTLTVTEEEVITA